nr:PREDICTED: cysteine-rich receptor-like protein kinase 10 isoform X2 [Daucus carota subsp. sativus]
MPESTLSLLIETDIFSAQLHRPKSPFSVYKTNLDKAFDNLLFAANTSNSGFYNASFGEESNRVYTLVLCRGDVQPDICRSCVKDSINMLKEQCPHQKEADEWYQECLLRYSNTSILNTLVTEPTRMHSGTVASDKAQFNQDLRDMLDNLKAQAIQQKFATAKQTTQDRTIYGLMQCTPDLSSTQCSNCLDKAIENIPTCCSGRTGGQVLKPSCRLRFEIGPFYDGTPSVDIQTPSAKQPPAAGTDNNKKQTIIIIVVVIVGTVTLLLVLFCIYKRKGKPRTAAGILPKDMVNLQTIQSIQYNFGTLEVATNCFSGGNKLGQGGFGAVYKGTLQNGERIAVKRLSAGSNQGQQEFINEVVIVAELQHKNLVRLHGYCYEGTERLLVYELLPNASLDHFILDSGKRTCMNWEIRYKIINGVARGLLYLHQDSRPSIIHRDLKASNVLLDAEMNPKIADFGMAKLFNLDETHGSTS